MEHIIERRCVWCSKMIKDDTEGFIDTLNRPFCCSECEDKYYISEEMETYETDEIRCPYCQLIYSDDLDSEYEAEGDEFECPNCGETFLLSAYTSTSFTAYPTPDKVDEKYKELKENQ